MLNIFSSLVVLVSQVAAQELVEVAAPASAIPQLWAGHVAVKGKKILPLLGNFEPRNDTWVLAVVTEHAGVLHFEQRPCHNRIAPMAGASVTMAPDAPPRLPGASFAFAPVGAGHASERWMSGWDETDVDLDGHPGLSIFVDAPLCGGAIYLTSTVFSSAQGTISVDGGFTGNITADVEQHILGASNACLRLVANDSKDRVMGAFAYVPVPQDTTCDSYDEASWPARATLPGGRR